MQREDTSKPMSNKSAGEQIDPAHRSADRSFRRQVAPVFFLTAIFFLNFIARVILSPLLPTIEKELAVNHGQAGFFFFLISSGYLSGLLGAGFLSSRTSHRRTILVSGTGVGLALFLLAGSSSAAAMRPGLYALGLAAGLYMPSAIATITALVDHRHWGKAIAIHELAPNLAFFTGPFVAELFLRHSTWRAALGLIGCASVLITLIYYRFGQGGRFAGESPASNAFGALVRTSAFWIMLILFGMGVSSTVGVYAMLPLYLVSDHQIGASWANAVTALSRSYGPIFGLLGGWVSDRLGPKRTMVVSLIVTGVLTLLLGLVGDSWISAVVIVQPALAVWFFPAGFAALAVIVPPQARNLAVGFTIPFGYLIGGGAIPTFIGIMGDAKLFPLGFTITGLLIIAAGTLALSLKLPGSGRSGH